MRLMPIKMRAKLRFVISVAVVGGLYLSLSMPADARDSNEVPTFCSRLPVENYVQDQRFFMTLSVSTLAAMLNGNEEKAKLTLEDNLANSVIEMSLIIKNRPCGVDDETVKKIYSTIRVVAAAHKLFPMKTLNTKDIGDIFSRAIADNPEHYDQLIKRAENWGNGIR